MLDANGYPTDAALEKIASYDFGKDFRAGIVGLVTLVTELWHWGDTQYKWDGVNLELHTGGWSGNEDIINALMGTMLWHMFWQKSERGGHYYFIIPKK
jgi:hypothetical protein